MSKTLVQMTAEIIQSQITSKQMTTDEIKAALTETFQVRIPVESGHHSGGKKATVPMGKRPAFRFDCGQHSDEKGQSRMRE